MHSRGLTHAKYMYYYWANWGLLIGITCNMNSGTPITITWRYLNVLEIRYIQRICFLAAISHQSTHYSKTLKTTATQYGICGNFLSPFAAKNIMKKTAYSTNLHCMLFSQFFFSFFGWEYNFMISTLCPTITYSTSNINH